MVQINTDSFGHQKSPNDLRGTPVESKATAGGSPLHLIIEFLQDLKERSSRVQLILTVLWGTVAMYVQTASDLESPVFANITTDETWKRILWWLLSVPLYMYLGIYFFRFLGSFLVRSWVQEVLASENVRKALLRSTALALEDDEYSSIFKAHACNFTAVILRSEQVQEAVVDMLLFALQSQELQCKVGELGMQALDSPVLIAKLQEFISREEFTSVLAKHSGQVLYDKDLRDSFVDLGQALLSDHRLKDVLHSRAYSFVQDKKVYQAGYKGMRSAFGCGPASCNPREEPVEDLDIDVTEMELPPARASY